MSDLILNAQAAPTTPASGKCDIYLDSTSKNLCSKDDAGAINHGVRTVVAVANQYLTAIADNGVGTLGTVVFGYVTGVGGVVTQATSKVTAFTLSKVCGNITFAADALAANTTSAGATWTNTQIAANDIVVFCHISGGTLGAYNVQCNPGAGTATITIRNLTPGSLSEAPVFRFTVIKGAIA